MATNPGRQIPVTRWAMSWMTSIRFSMPTVGFVSRSAWDEVAVSCVFQSKNRLSALLAGPSQKA
jgi:hypothetical protein